MNTVIKGTKTIAEYKRVREDMENLARANYARHKEAFEEWGEGEPVKAWFDFEGNFCIEYESGKWWHYNDKPFFNIRRHFLKAWAVKCSCVVKYHKKIMSN